MTLPLFSPVLLLLSSTSTSTSALAFKKYRTLAELSHSFFYHKEKLPPHESSTEQWFFDALPLTHSLHLHHLTLRRNETMLKIPFFDPLGPERYTYPKYCKGFNCASSPEQLESPIWWTEDFSIVFSTIIVVIGPEIWFRIIQAVWRLPSLFYRDNAKDLLEPPLWGQNTSVGWHKFGIWWDRSSYLDRVSYVSDLRTCHFPLTLETGRGPRCPFRPCHCLQIPSSHDEFTSLHAHILPRVCSRIQTSVLSLYLQTFLLAQLRCQQKPSRPSTNLREMVT